MNSDAASTTVIHIFSGGSSWPECEYEEDEKGNEIQVMLHSALGDDYGRPQLSTTNIPTVKKSEAEVDGAAVERDNDVCGKGVSTDTSETWTRLSEFAY